MISRVLFFVSFIWSINTVQAQGNFVEVIVEGREAYMSTKNGLIAFRTHSNTDPKAFILEADDKISYLETTYHDVVKGETLNSIAKKYQIPLNELKHQNDLKDSKLAIKQRLKIQKKIAIEVLAPKIESKGESRIIAKLRPGEVPGMNNKPTTPIEQSNTTTTEASKDLKSDANSHDVNAVDTTINAAGAVYTVKKGDTLWEIAKKHNLSVTQLKTLNKLTSNALSIGQKLRLK